MINQRVRLLPSRSRNSELYVPFTSLRLSTMDGDIELRIEKKRADRCIAIAFRGKQRPDIDLKIERHLQPHLGTENKVEHACCQGSQPHLLR